MKSGFCCSLKGAPSPTDLRLYRDAVLTYCAALRAKAPVTVVQATSEALDLLNWLGIDFECQADGHLEESPEWLLALGPTETLPKVSLASFREQGFLGATLFATLVRSSYGPSEDGFFPTPLELSIYFDEKNLLSGPARWDQEYLEDCQAFFFEELTPSELLEQIYRQLPEKARIQGQRFEPSLLGVAFLLGEQSRTLKPLTDFFARLLLPKSALPELREVLSSLEDWSLSSIERACRDLNTQAQKALTDDLLRDLWPQASTLLYACGRDLLEWRAS